MKKLMIITMLLIVGIVEGRAQERIDALLSRDISQGTTTLRMAVKRDPATGEVIKRVKELTATSNRALAKEFIEAFEAERDSAVVWEQSNISGVYQVTAVWQDPKRVYSINVTGGTLVVYAQTIYREDKTTNKNSEF